MTDAEREIYLAAIGENAITVLAAAACVGMLALGTGSLHSLWGLLILLNINTIKRKRAADEA